MTIYITYFEKQIIFEGKRRTFAARVSQRGALPLTFPQSGAEIESTATDIHRTIECVFDRSIITAAFDRDPAIPFLPHGSCDSKTIISISSHSHQGCVTKTASSALPILHVVTRLRSLVQSRQIVNSPSERKHDLVLWRVFRRRRSVSQECA